MDSVAQSLFLVRLRAMAEAALAAAAEQKDMGWHRVGKIKKKPSLVRNELTQSSPTAPRDPHAGCIQSRCRPGVAALRGGTDRQTDIDR